MTQENNLLKQQRENTQSQKKIGIVSIHEL